MIGICPECGKKDNLLYGVVINNVYVPVCSTKCCDNARIEHAEVKAYVNEVRICGC